MIYLQLFLSFLQIGAFSSGGRYAAMPLVQGQIVSQHGWLNMGRFTDLITISRMTPGPIAVNSTTSVGIKIAGIPGAVIATAGCVLPSYVTVTLLVKLCLEYRDVVMLQGILDPPRLAVVSMIASAGILILVSAFWGSDAPIRLSNTSWNLMIIFDICVVLLQKMGMDPILVMVLANILGMGASWIGIRG